MNPWDGENAKDFFYKGQIVRPTIEALQHFHGERFRNLGYATVVGFGRLSPWCVIVIRSGRSYTQSFSGTFWEPYDPTELEAFNRKRNRVAPRITPKFVAAPGSDQVRAALRRLADFEGEEGEVNWAPEGAPARASVRTGKRSLWLRRSLVSSPT